MSEYNPGRGQEALDRKNGYILVVENDTKDLVCTSLLLHRFAYPVCTARTAQQALDMVAVAPPILMVTELFLPDMNGLDLMRVLSRDVRTVSIPVILIVPQGDTIVEKQCIEIGGSVAWLPKPVQVDDLYRAVQRSVEPTPRSSIRIGTRLPVIINKVALKYGEGECATHLSELGAYVRTLKPRRKSQHISLSMIIDGRTVSTNAEVLYSHRFSDGPGQDQGMAVRFLTITPEDRALVRQYIQWEITRGIVEAP